MLKARDGKQRKESPKPYVPGTPLSKLAVKRGTRILAYLLISAFLFLFLGQLMSLGQGLVRVLINLVILMAFASLLYMEGAKIGEDDVAFGEIAYSRRENGHTIPRDDLARCFHPIKGFVTAAAGVLPLFLVCLIFAFVAQKQVYRLGALPDWVTAFERDRSVQLALSYYHETMPVLPENILRVLVRLLLFPYVSIFGPENADAMLFMERLSPLLVLLVPSFFGVGYLRGPAQRSMVHSDIAKNAKRRVRREKKARKKRVEKNERII